MNQRQRIALTTLANHPDFLTTKQLAGQLQSSERTLRNDLHVISAYLTELQTGLTLERKQGTGIRLVGTPRAKQQLQASLNGAETNNQDHARLQQLLIFQLLRAQSPISIEELAEKVFANRRTVRHELTQLQPFAQKNGLEIISKPRLGTYIAGNEQQKRQLLVQTLRQIQANDPQAPTLQHFFAPEQFQVVQNVIRETFNANQLPLPPEVANVDIHVYFMLERMKQGQTVQLSAEENAAVADSPAQALSGQILAQLADIYPLAFSPDEINYLALRLANFFANSQATGRFEPEARALANYLIAQVQQLLALDLSDDPSLRQNLVNHLSSSYFRLNYGLPIANPLTPTIFNTYPQLFLVIQLSLENFFQTANLFVPAEEVAYLTIHFQAAVERQDHQKSNRYQALLVTGYSKAMAIFIEARLQRELPELQIKDILENQPHIQWPHLDQIDLIISTVPLADPGKPVVQISPMITDQDLSILTKYLLEHVPQKHLQTFDLAHFTAPSLVFPQLELSEPEEILKKLAQNLVDNNYATSAYAHSVLLRDQRGGTNVAPLITLPHGDPHEVKISTLSIATLARPVQWQGEAIQLVILLAIKQQDLKDPEFRKLFAVIHYLEAQPQRLTSVWASRSPLALIKQLSQYE
ncbi:BglG family transcription antiterminator [Lapidilactobacillus achengensis]|uniref:BglG family transcription antiterminator n=1 Tax=Lapidilactobacillus achengensis TaxID=2486000 RepID=A0ABW1UQF3_9LACO|nr:BglG family transcription antiterminator [Lapidilactobacillus achengensis]